MAKAAATGTRAAEKPRRTKTSIAEADDIQAVKILNAAAAAIASDEIVLRLLSQIRPEPEGLT